MYSQESVHMRNLAMTLIAAAFVVGSMALANAQSQQGAGSLKALAQNATPVVKDAACRGWGAPLSSWKSVGLRPCWLLVSSLLVSS